MKNKKNIVLIGFMGAGKSTVSREIARTTGREEIDLDSYIVEKEGCPINEMFEKHGEEYFRTLETKYLKEVSGREGIILSCGGGTVIKRENVDIIKENGVLVLLSAKPETIYERVKNSTDRPILNGNMNIEFITELMNKRKDIYLSVADLIIETDGKMISSIGKEIMEKYSTIM